MTATTAKAHMPSRGVTRLLAIGEEDTASAGSVGSVGSVGANHSPSGRVSQWGPDRSMGSDRSSSAAGSTGG